MSGPAGLVGKVVALADGLEVAGLPYALGGALALAYYAEPRATVDIDVNIFVSPPRWVEVARALAPLGIAVEAVPPELVARDGQVRVWWDTTPVDVFLAYDDLHDAADAGARQVPFAGRRIRILSATHLVVCKAVLDRRKDWLDIEQILVGSGVDRAEVRRWLDRFLPDGDARRERFESAVRRT